MAESFSEAPGVVLFFFGKMSFNVFHISNNNNNSLFDPIMKNTIRNTILENKLRYGHPKNTIRACLGWMTLVKSYIVKWCDNRVFPWDFDH